MPCYARRVGRHGLDVRLSADPRALPTASSSRRLDRGGRPRPAAGRRHGPAAAAPACRCARATGRCCATRARVGRGGVLVLDADPPPLRRRGAAAGAPPTSTTRRGARPRRSGGAGPSPGRPGALGVPLDDLSASRWWASGWSTRTPGGRGPRRSRGRRRPAAAAPLEAGLPAEAARRALDLPDLRLLARSCGRRPGAPLGGCAARAGRPGPAERSVAQLEERLRADAVRRPRGARPRRARLARASSRRRARRRRCASRRRVLLPDAPARAIRVLAGLPQPFTISQAARRSGRRGGSPSRCSSLDGRAGPGAWTDPCGRSAIGSGSPDLEARHAPGSPCRRRPREGRACVDPDDRGSGPRAPRRSMVRLETCGVFHTDLHYREGGINQDFPFLLGHEAAVAPRGPRRGHG